MIAKRTLLVTGANGFVAGSVLAQAGDEWEAHAISRGPAPANFDGPYWHSADLLTSGVLEKLFRDIGPGVVIHTAAAADIDFCQANPKAAREVNVELTRHLAKLCANTGARLIFCSTDTIFDGENPPYDENDLPHPVNVYAETKVEAEQFVRELGSSGVIARLSLVMGLPLIGTGNSFLSRLLDSLAAGKTVGVTEHEIRTPVDVITVGRALLELAGGDHDGIFHLAGLSRINRLELNRAIARKFGFSKDLLVAQSAAPGRAPRPRDVSLTIAKTQSELNTPMLTLDEGLSLIVEKRHAQRSK